MPHFQRAWVTGGSSGIGRALARRLAAAGTEVIVSARNEERLTAVAAELGAHPLPLDVTDAAAVEAAVEAIWRAFGPLDLAVLNAGGSVSGGDKSAAELEANLRLNLLSAAYGVDALRPRMRAAGGGTIVLLGSLAGYLPLPRAYGYAVSKAALIHYAAALAPALAEEGIRLKLANPGFVNTPLVRQNRFPMPAMLEPEEAARRILGGLAGSGLEIAFPRRLAWPLRLLRALPLNAWVRLSAFAERRVPRRQ